MMRYAVKSERAAKVLQTLRGLRVHPHFPGYLAVKKASLAFPNVSHAVDFKALYDAYFHIVGGPTRYVNALLDKQPTRENVWRNDNIAGSYAPSSIRDGQPFERVISLDRDSDAPYRLKAQHWKKAREVLLYGNPLPIIPLAVFLYRDFTFESASPSLDPWMHRFQQEFGYLTKRGKPTSEFSHLYTDDSGDYDAIDWVELYEGSLMPDPDEPSAER